MIELPTTLVGLAALTIIALLAIVGELAHKNRLQREELSRFWDAEDARRLVALSEPGICDHCGVDVEDYRELCSACQRNVLQSGDVG